MLTNMRVLALPPSESCISMVSLLLRYGMNCCSLLSAEITSPRAERDLLMDIASCKNAVVSVLLQLILSRFPDAHGMKLYASDCR